MLGRYILIFVVISVLFSCVKFGSDGSTYIVSASKMIRLTGNNWNNAESQLRNKKGYKYAKSPDNLSYIIKATVDLMAIDDSNRHVNGDVLLNVAPDNTINFASFNTDPIGQAAAYAMMLNYNHQTLQTLTAISFSIGEITENNMGGNVSVSVILAKLNSGQMADKLAISYNSSQGNFSMVIFRQSDGRYIFSYRGSR